MNLFIDDQALATFAYRTSSDEYGPRRRYYVARAPFRAILVCQNNLDLKELRRKCVDAIIGEDAGWRDFVREENIDKPHLKITIFRVLKGQALHNLSSVLASAPRDDRKTRL